ncbi:hypothetical protein KIW84_013408 [Lathyrus oleraceus]|uniref:Uncharacterized protein n=1 Tax=Pisum sativum TaxID=3888 RepID=A0A9D5BJZ3_PEA|nr:hypothetical protein KIW84_013408 [Pisum sativum]
MVKARQDLEGIGDLKAPGIDGFGAKFFKASWHIIKGDVIEAIMEFFKMGRTIERHQARGSHTPLLFVIIMEYMNISLTKMQKDHNFNHPSKCEKLALTNLTFVDTVLLFSRGDQKSVEMMLDAFKKFSESTGLIVKPVNFKIYCGGIYDITKGSLINMTRFEEGHLPVRYLGVPLSRKKLSINHYFPLV